MRVIRFNKSKHFTPLQECWAAHGAYVPKDVPKVGFIAVKDHKLVAAVFLRRVEGGYGQIDGLVSNPTSSPEDRNKAIDLVSTKIMEQAKKLCPNGVLMMTKCKNTLMRSQKYGFEKSLLTVLAADLNKRSV